MEDDADHLRQPHEGRRPSGRELERLQRESGSVQRRQVRHVDRRDGRRVLRHQSEAVQGRRQGRLRAGAEQRPGQERATGSGPGTSPFPPARRRSRRPRSSSPGRPARNTPSSSLPRKAGPTCRREPAPRSIRTRSIRKSAPFAKLTLDIDRLGRPQPPDGEAGAVCRRAIRRHSGIPGHRHRRRPAVLRGACRDHRRSMRPWPRRSRRPSAR